MNKKVDVVGAVIYNDINDTYLVTRRNSKKHKGGFWEFPGGKIESGESPEEALVREIKEELKCKISVHNMIKDYTHEYDEITVRLITYLCRIEEDEPVITEHEEMLWVNKEELDSLSFAEADIPTVIEIKNYGGK